jgi:hypothetical protein
MRASLASAALLAATALAVPGIRAATPTAQTRPAPPRPAGWVLLGSAHAKHTKDHDQVAIYGPNDKYRQLKIAVSGASLHLKKLVVTYRNGSKETLPVIYFIKKGTETKAISLDSGGGRSVREVDMWYDTRGWLNGTSDVKLYGRY